MTESNFLMEFRIKTTSLQNFKDYQAELECLKEFILNSFQKSILQSISFPATLAILTCK